MTLQSKSDPFIFDPRADSTRYQTVHPCFAHGKAPDLNPLAARVQRLYKAGPRTPQPYTPTDAATADHTSAHHDWPLALQPEDQARW
jgi:hypothetical protein